MTVFLGPKWDVPSLDARNVGDGQLLRRVGTTVVGYNAPVIVPVASALTLAAEHDQAIIELAEAAEATFPASLPETWAAVFVAEGEDARIVRGEAAGLRAAGYGDRAVFILRQEDSMASAYVRANGVVRLVGDVEGDPYPTVTAIAGGGGPGLSSHVVDFPGPVREGALQVIAYRSGAGSTTHTLSGWNSRTRDNNGRTTVFWRIAPSSPGSSATVAQGAIAPAAWVCVTIEDVYLDDERPGGIQPWFAGSNTLDPPAFSVFPDPPVPWLCMVVASTRRTDNALIAPDDFDAVITGASTGAAGASSTNNCRVAVAFRRMREVVLFDPPPFGSTGTIDNPHAAIVPIGQGENEPAEP